MHLHTVSGGMDRTQKRRTTIFKKITVKTVAAEAEMFKHQVPNMDPEPKTIEPTFP